MSHYSQQSHDMEKEEHMGLLESDEEAFDDPLTSASAAHPTSQSPPFSALDFSELLMRRPLPSKAQSLLRTLTPSFLQKRFFPDSPDAPAEKVHKTAYLDGIRGVAAFIVFIFHFSATVYGSVLEGFGSSPENRWIAQLPIIRVAYHGSAMVSIFFVVSGYALSIAPVKYMNNSDSNKTALHRSLASAVFRRPFRLFLPTWISTIIPFFLIYWGVYEATRPLIDGHILSYLFQTEGQIQGFGAAFSDWLWNNYQIFEVFNTDPGDTYEPNTRYNKVAWTIPVEFRASLLLYLTHLCTSHLKRGVRLPLIIALSVLSIWTNRWEMNLFWAGFALAEVDYMIHEEEASTGVPYFKHRWSKPVLWGAFVLALHFCSVPTLNADRTPGYVWMMQLVPTAYTRKHRFWEGIGAIMIVFCVSRLEKLTAIFGSPVARYLGKLSFSLYLMHWWMLQAFGVWIIDFVFKVTGQDTTIGKGIGYVTSFLLFLPMVIVVSDLYWRLVDQKTVAFARWLETKCAA